MINITSCGRFTAETVAQPQASDDMHTDARPHIYVEEYEKMRNCSSTTMPVDFNHIMQHNNTLQMAVSEQYLRYIVQVLSLVNSTIISLYWNHFLFSHPLIFRLSIIKQFVLLPVRTY